MIKIVTIVGARPQFIKASAFSREVAKHNDIEEIIIHTGQHFDANMSDIFFTEMDIPTPKYQLSIHSLGHGAMTGRMLEEIEKVLISENPDIVLVYGDTNSTLAGALAARKLQIKVAHVEAGLRSYNMAMPEEINRILTDRISDILFCPTEQALSNLQKEGFATFETKIVKVGDVMFDAALYYKQKAEKESTVVQDLNLIPNEYVLATIHRQENTDDPTRLRAIIESLNEINEDKTVVVPLHPRTKNIISKMGIKPAFTIIEPVGYLDMIKLISSSYLVMTDSGGLQKEAYFFQKYCLTLRDQTEWVELVSSGYNSLVGADTELITNTYNEVKAKTHTFTESLYGNGNSAAIIVEELRKL